MRKGLARRLDRIADAFESGRYVLLLEDGERLLLDPAADLHLMLAVIDAQALADETGAPVAIGHPHIELFARSVPRAGEGALAAAVRQWSRDYLAQRKAEL